MNPPDRPNDIAVTVLGGYLGAGKTTLVNHILRSASERIVVLVNDFGSVNIDDALIVAADDDKITLANGCICCSLVDGLAAALEQVRRLDPPPARLVIEASGVSDPASIAAYGHDRGLRLDGVVTVVDAETVRARARDRYVGDTVIRQIVAADLLVINKVDLVSPGDLAEVRAWLAVVSHDRPMLEAVQGEVELTALLGIDPKPQGDAPTGPQNADEIFTTWSITTAEPFNRESLQAVLTSWPADVVRVKGIVRVAGPPGQSDGRVIVHRVGTRLTLTDAGPWTGALSNLVAIGLRATMDPTALDNSARSTIAVSSPSRSHSRPRSDSTNDHAPPLSRS